MYSLFVAFVEESNLTIHQSIIHTTKKDCVCDNCGSYFVNKIGLLHHMKTHLPRPFACSKCDWKFVNVVHLQNHLKHHKGNLNEICKHCNKGFETKGSLHMHIIGQHLSKFHNEIPNCMLEYLELKSDFFDDQTEAWGELIYNKREFEKRKLTSQLKGLKKQVQAKDGTEAGPLEDFIRVDGLFNCPECPHKTKFKACLKVHINAIHRKIKPWMCSECDKGWFVIKKNYFNIYFLFYIYYSICPKSKFNTSSK